LVNSDLIPLNLDLIKQRNYRIEPLEHSLRTQIVLF
jgi:hypothetical protein